MLATRLPGVLPALDDEQALEVTAVHSVAGMLDDDTPLITRPPFVDPHHSASLAAVVGGGSAHIRPGSVSLAHRGVLFLDEAPEFRPTVLDALRQPMESGAVLLARASGAVRYPARFQLILAANPCPCAAAKDVDCTCAAGVRRRYLGRLSGPLMDRIDIRVDLAALDPVDVDSAWCGGGVERGGGGSGVVGAGSVGAAVAGDAVAVFGGGAGCDGAPVVAAGSAGGGLLDRAVRTGRLTGRGYDRVLRLALTAADLAGRERPSTADVADGVGVAMRGGVVNQAVMRGRCHG